MAHWRERRRARIETPLDVILRKVREIKKTTGINVPFPEDSKSIIDPAQRRHLLQGYVDVLLLRDVIGFRSLDRPV
jgi:hypothetical protein